MKRTIQSLIVLVLFSACSSSMNTVNTNGYIQLTDGAEIYYSQWGSGKNKILIPAALFLENDFKSLANNDRTLIFYDMRNRGRSSYEADSSMLSIDQDIKDLEEIRDHFGLDKISLIGYSYLGLMIALYAHEHPEKVERLIQIGPVPLKFGTKYKREFTAQDTVPVVDVIASKKLDSLYLTNYHRYYPKEFCEMDWEVIKYSLVGKPENASKLVGVCDYENEWPVNLYRHFQFHFGSVQKLQIGFSLLSNLSCPVLVVHGTKDRNAPQGSGREWAYQLENSKMITVPNAAHNLWVETNILPELSHFLDGNWPSSAVEINDNPVSYE